MAKSAAYEISYPDDCSTVTVKFADGETATLTIANLDPDVARRATCHGLKQKLADAAAGAKGDVAESKDSIMAVFERLQAGDWSREREAAGPRPTLVAEAVVRALTKMGKTFDEAAVRAMFTGKESAQNRADIVKDKAVAIELAALKAEREQARIAAMADGGLLASIAG